MSNESKKLIKDSAIYGATGVLQKAISVLLLPLYTVYLTPSDYGVITILTITAQLMNPFATLMVGSGLSRIILYRKKNEKIAMKTAFQIVVIGGGIIYTSLILFSGQLSWLLLGANDYANLLRMLFASAFLGNLGHVVMQKVRIQKKPVLYMCLNCTQFFLTLVLNVYFVAVRRMGIEGIVLSMLTISCLFSPVYVALLMRYFSARFSVKYMREMLSFSVPLVPSQISSSILTLSDRYFLGHYSDLRNVGLYSIGYRIAMVMDFAIQGIQLALFPAIFSIARERNGVAFFRKSLTEIFNKLTTPIPTLNLPVAKEIHTRDQMITKQIDTQLRILP